MINRIKTVAVRFANDEEGMEAVQIVMTIAIAAMVVMGISKVVGITGNGTEDSGLFGSIGRTVGGFLDDKAGSVIGNFF